jgi:MFS superfamily sulfate permease-like transporter
VLGFSVESSKLVGRVVEIVRGVAAGLTNPTSLALGLGSLTLILVLKRWAPRVPGILLAVILATVAVGVFGLAEQGIAVVGSVPSGLPSLVIPSVRWSDLGLLLVGAAGISLVAFTDTSVISRTFAARAGQAVDPNREMVALGIANAFTGLFQGFPISSSASRTPVAESAGAKTQVTGLVGAVAVACLLVFAPTLLTNLPMAALGAVVIAAAIGLAEVKGVRRLFRERQSEFWLSMAAFLSVALLGVLRGIAIGVGLSLLNFIRLAWWPHDTLLGRAPGVKGYHDIGRYGSAEQVPGLILYRFDAPLFFANAHLFGERVMHLVKEAEPPAQWVIVAAEPITDVDTTAADMLEELAAQLDVAGIALAFAELKDPVKDRLERYGLVDRLGPGRFFPTVGVAVKAYVRTAGVGWTDWEDAAEAVHSGSAPDDS